MTLAELRERPTVINTSEVSGRMHESIFRSYGMLMKVQELLMLDPPVPHCVLLEMIDDVMDAPEVNKEPN